MYVTYNTHTLNMDKPVVVYFKAQQMSNASRSEDPFTYIRVLVPTRAEFLTMCIEGDFSDLNGWLKSIFGTNCEKFDIRLIVFGNKLAQVQAHFEHVYGPNTSWWDIQLDPPCQLHVLFDVTCERWIDGDCEETQSYTRPVIVTFPYPLVFDTESEDNFDLTTRIVQSFLDKNVFISEHLVVRDKNFNIRKLEQTEQTISIAGKQRWQTSTDDQGSRLFRWILEVDQDDIFFHCYK